MANLGNTIINGVLRVNGKITASALSGNLEGNAESANKLLTPRKINGVVFDGTSDITVQDETKLPLTGNAASASKLATARNISLTGDSVATGTFDGSGDLKLSVKRRGASVGQSAGTSTNPWYKFADISVSGINEDKHIIFSVYMTYGDGSLKMGILKAHIRTQENGYWGASELMWMTKSSNIATSDFVLAHNTGTNPTVVELWCNIPVGWTGYNFDVIAEGGRTARRTDTWKLYNTWTAGSTAEVSTSLVKQNSTTMTLGHNIAGNVTGNAGTATKLQSAKTINNTSFDGSANIRLKDYYTLQLGGYANMTGVYTTFAKMPRGNTQQMGQATLLFSAMGDFGGNIPRNIFSKYF